MAEWVWFSGQGRIKHIALMRKSRASRRFALENILLASVGVALAESSRAGWRWVTQSPVTEPTGSITPAGTGWFHVAQMARPLPVDLPPDVAVDLWWSPAQTSLAAVLALLLGFAGCWVVLFLVRQGLTWAHRPAYRREGRMTAALHYGTAGSIPLFLAAVILALRPIAFLATIRRWPWCPPDLGFVLSAAVLAGIAAALWWYWLVRLGETAPANTRGRVVAFSVLGLPVVVGGLVVGWWFGFVELTDLLFGRLGLSF